MGFALPAHRMIPPGFPGFFVDDKKARDLQRFDPKLTKATPFEGSNNWPIVLSIREEALASKPMAEAVQGTLLATARRGGTRLSTRSSRPAATRGIPRKQLEHDARAEEILQTDVGHVPVTWVVRYAVAKRPVRGIEKNKAAEQVI